MTYALEDLRLTRRRALGLFLVPISLGLAACGGSAASNTPAASQASTPTAPPAATSEPTAAATPTPAPTATTATPAATPAPTTAAPAPTEAPPSQVAVQIVDFAFDPPTITVPAGTTIVWTNVGPTIHNVVSQDGVWESPIMEAGATYQFTFDEPGEYPYWCTLHPTMLGSVTVQ